MVVSLIGVFLEFSIVIDFDTLLLVFKKKIIYDEN